MTEKRPLRSVISEWLLGGGAVIALVTGAINYFDRDKERTESRHKEACSRALSAIVDDGLNPALSDAQKQAFIAQELNVAVVCARDSGS